ncbi:MAG: hypothetical protein AAGG38_08750 [Planctomycetota bacterium]
MPRLTARFWTRLGVSLAAVAALTVPAAMVALDHRERSATISQLGSPDPGVQERALNRLIRRAPRDPGLVDAAIQRLPSLPARAVLPTLRALDEAGSAQTPPLQHALESTLPRLRPDSLLAVRPYLQDHRAWLAAARRLLADPDLTPAQQQALLDHLAADATTRDLPDVVMGRVTRDRHAALPGLRRRAARLLATAPLPPPDSPSYLAWSRALDELLTDPAPSVRVAALSAAAGLVPADPPRLSALKDARQDPDPAVARWAEELFAMAVADSSASARPALILDPPPIGFDPTLGHALRPTLIRTADHPSPDWILATLRLNHRPAARDRAALAAAERFDPPTLDGLIDTLLTGHDPDGRISAAVLVGLTGQQIPLLEHAARREHLARVRTMMQAGLWMQYRWPAGDRHVPALIHRPGLPVPTLLLALLHRGEVALVLEHLLTPSPQAAEPGALPAAADLLIGRRWAEVLWAYLPSDAPAFPPTLDPAAIAERLATLRAWTAVHRRRLTP